MSRDPLFKEAVYTEILIDTSAEKVWKIITNFSQYNTWNIPLVILGECVLNAPLKIQANMPGRKPTTFRGHLLVCRELEMLEWIGYTIAPIMFSGRHAFEIIKIDDTHVKFVNKESFTGLAIPFIKENLLRSKVKDFHNDTNLVIKRLAETL
jgi:hypothetical protein